MTYILLILIFIFVFFKILYPMSGETTSRLLSLLPTTPADDKSFLVQIAGNYCPDEEYWRLLPLLLDHFHFLLPLLLFV